MISRRDFLKNTLACSVLGGVNPFSQQTFTTEDLELSKVSIPSQKIGPALNAYKIAFISDLHCGVFLSERLLKNTIDFVNSAAPDLLILGGDYIGIPDNNMARTFSYLRTANFNVKRSSKLVTKIFSEFGAALLKVKTKDGIYGVMGNHDHWNNGDICIKMLREFGVNMLINEEASIQKNSEKLVLYGTDDYWTGIPRISESFKNNNPNDFRIFISHNPDYIGETVYNSKAAFDLGLAGHTHGGQIHINGLGSPAGYNCRHKEFAVGTKHYGQSIIHTSRGIGVVDVPYRLNVRPEVTIFELKSV